MTELAAKHRHAAPRLDGTELDEVAGDDQLGAYREMFGWDHPGEAIGPEPAPTFPEAHAE